VTPKFKDRRSSPRAGKVPLEPPPPAPRQAGPAGPGSVRDAAGFHTMEAVREFIQYDLDGGAQTEWNERFVTPLCMAVVGIDGLARLPSDAARDQLVATVGETLRKLTRRADRLARSGDNFVVLLRRTLSKKAHDFYVPNARKALVDACGDSVNVSVGIASVTEHMIKSAEDMIMKAFTAFEVAKKQGGGATVIYDFRTMPY
jgi:GGDEF domain-containing protein